MVQNFNHGTWWKKEKGLTIVEIIVSLAVIVIVSLAVVSVALFSTKTQANTHVKQYFSRMVNDIAMMYESYEDEKFELAFNNYTGQTIEYGVDIVYYFNSSFQYQEESGSAYSLRCDFDVDTLKVTASYSDNTLIHERSVSK